MARKKHDVTPAARNDAILNALRVRKNMTTGELRDLLGVSEMTVRRCLARLAEEGLVQRIHGGASAVVTWEKDRLFQNRLMEGIEVKSALAARALDFVPENGSIFLDGGTTCYEIAKRIGQNGTRVTIITDSIAIARELGGGKVQRTILLGGELSDDGNTLDGPLTAEIAGKMSVNVSIFSADGFNDNSVENRDFIGLLAKRVMLQRAERKICVTSSDKYGKQKSFHFFDWDEIDVFITDSRLPDTATAAIRAKGVTIHMVDRPAEA